MSARLPSPACVGALLVLAFATGSSVLAAGEPFGVAPPGTWVRPLVPPTDATAASPESAGVHYLVFDRQIRAGRGEREDYFQVVWKVESTAGLQDASEIEIGFDPTFERLVIHHARVLRGGRAVWSFSRAEVLLADTEQDTEARLYNGERTATIPVKGLRVGDSVDYAYTLQGVNPVLGGHFDSVLGFEYSRPVDRVHRRLVWQRDAQLRINPRGDVPRPAVTKAARETVYDWDRLHSRAARSEERTPSWFVSRARVELSDFAGWTEVARRAETLFAVVDAPAPALDALVRGWNLSTASEDARIDKAVRFVQDEVRYLGLEMGPHSHQPHAPAETLERRFGDCKDKSALLVALLRRLGVKAWPALASTTERQGLDDRLPSLFAFDHAIVALRAGTSLQFVDATASEQGGRVRGRRPPPFARALVVDRATPGLSQMPYLPPETPTIEVAETFALAAWGSPTRLDVVTTYRDEEADEMRQSQARATRAELGRKYREFYAQDYGAGVRALELPQLADDREHNVVVVREAYEIPSLWQRGAHEFRAWCIDQKLVRPRVVDRSAPLSVAHPDNVRQTVTVRLPGPPELAPLHETVDSPAFSMDASWSVRGNEARLQYSYRSLRGSLSPKDVPLFVDRLDRAADLVVCRVGLRRSAAPAPRETDVTARTGAVLPSAAAAAGTRRGGPAALWPGSLLAGACMLGLAFWGARAGLSGWRARRRRAAFRPRIAYGSGERPQTAIRVRSFDTLPLMGWGGVCACGGAWRETERSPVQYDGRPMLVLTRRCGSCAGEVTLYVRALGPEQAGPGAR